MTFRIERQAQLREAYDQLSKPMQAAVRLRLEGQRPSYIARALGITTVEARLLLSTALNRLTASPIAR